MPSPIPLLAEAIQTKQPAVLVTVIEVVGASPAKLGAQLVLLDDGRMAGTIGGGRLEASVLTDARDVLAGGNPTVFHYALAETGTDAIGTLCGGEVRVFVQPYNPPPRLVIVGGGHIGQPLQVMAEAAGFDVIVVDVEPGLGAVSELTGVDMTADTFVVLITADHVSDEAALRQIVDLPVPYIGMIGSRSKCAAILDRLDADGYTAEALAHVYAPIGLDLGGSTPAEIAIAILAEIITVRCKGSGAHRSHK